jgi:hypothetical protein
MSVLDTVQDQLLDAIAAGEEAVLTGVKTLAQGAQPITGILPDVPFADRLPDPVAVVDNAFGFAEKLLANQKDFAIKLVEAYRPSTSTSTSTPKPAPKRAAKSTRPSTKAS